MATDITKTVEDLEAVVSGLEQKMQASADALKAKDAEIASLQQKLAGSSTYVTDDLAGKLSGAVQRLQSLVG